MCTVHLEVGLHVLQQNHIHQAPMYEVHVEYLFNKPITVCQEF